MVDPGTVDPGTVRPGGAAGGAASAPDSRHVLEPPDDADDATDGADSTPRAVPSAVVDVRVALPMPAWTRILAAVVGLAAAVAGTAAVFRTDNGVGSAALLLVAVFLTITAVDGQFPRLKIGDNEVMSNLTRAFRETTGKAERAAARAVDAQGNSEDVMDGLADARARIVRLEQLAGVHRPPPPGTGPGDGPPGTPAGPGGLGGGARGDSGRGDGTRGTTAADDGSRAGVTPPADDGARDGATPPADDRSRDGATPPADDESRGRVTSPADDGSRVGVTAPGGDVAFDVGLGVATPPDEAAPGFPDALLDLADRYRTLRWTMPRGAARTRAMTGLVDEMRAAVRAAGDVDVRPLLGDDDIGLRLVAAAALHERPDARAVRPLAEQALSDRKPFNEYWSLLALRRCLHGRCDLLTDDLRDRLERRSAEVRQDADRANAIARILRDCP